jgi:hypothetical protein
VIPTKRAPYSDVSIDLQPETCCFWRHSDWRKFEAYANERNGDGSFVKPEQAAKMELALQIKDKLNEYRKSKHILFDRMAFLTSEDNLTVQI